MHRRMTITVINTGVKEDWILDNYHLDHGKWMAGSPPASIPVDGTTEIKSEKQTGASYGTTGWIKFVSTIIPNNTLSIKWNKPYGTDPTTCTAEVLGNDYQAEGKNKDFQKSYAFCDIVITAK